METELVEAARARLLEYGVECSVRFEQSPLVQADATIALRWGASRQRFSVHAMSSVRLAGVLAARGETPGPMVVAPWISSRVGAQLRAAEVAYVDTVGNASVRFGTVLIEVSGRPKPAPDATGASGEGRTPGSLVSPANRRVIAALLADPALEVGTLRERAAAAGVSLGQAHKTTTLLADAGFHRDRLDDEQRAALRAVLTAISRLR
jgi:hypothetical protein